MKYSYWGYSTKGIRSNNEDSFLLDDQLLSDDTQELERIVLDLDITQESKKPLWHVFAVADGMGGHAAGEVASRLALQRLAEVFKTIGDLSEEILRSLLLDLHRYILEQGRLQKQPGMGCTLTGAVFHSEALWIFNIGDSRTYRMVKGFLNQVTKDHNMKALSGIPDGAQNHLYSCLGGGAEDCTVDVWDLSDKITDSETLLLASDGYHEFINMDFWEESLAKPWDRESFRQETVSVVEKGSKDNATVVILQIQQQK